MSTGCSGALAAVGGSWVLVTPEQISLVEATLEDRALDLDAVAADFYHRLFAADPTMAAMFSADPDVQRRRFATELQAICRAIRRHPDFLAGAGALGARHRRYGVEAAHYRAAGPPLLDALAAALGHRWTPEVAEAWRLAYHLTVEAMSTGTAS
jgi:hemoglobin-like flavoprotein